MGSIFVEILERMNDEIDAAVDSIEDCFPPQIRLRHETLFVRDSWLDLGALDTLIAGIEGVRESRVTWDGTLVVAHVSLSAGYTPFEVHEFVLSQLHVHRNIRAPDRYIWTRARGAARQYENRVWDPRVDTPFLAPKTDAECCLCDAIGSVHGFEVVDTAKTFIEGGGQLLLAPAVVERLREAGWAGLRRCHFASPFTLRSVARTLTRTH
jgi:hypothetical protein